MLLRFTFAYLFLDLFPRPLSRTPYIQKVFEPYQKLWDALVVWVGERWFGLEIVPGLSGSGDRSYDYVRLLCCWILAVAVTLVWTLLARKRFNDARLHEWLRVYLRFTLSTVMFVYGMAKLIPSQFTVETELNRLIQPIGEASPMGLLWTFMGATLTYNIFTGAVETLGGLLLIARRTTLLGALVCIGALANVVMLNFTYDVPVKLFSSHLLLAAVVLAAPDLRRLADVFVFNRGVRPAEHHPLIARPALGRVARVLWTASILSFLLYSVYNNYKLATDPLYSNFGPKPPLYGIWKVEELVIDGEARPPLLTDPESWRYWIFEYPNDVTLYSMDKRKGYEMALDTGRKTLGLTDYRDEKKIKHAFSYRQPAPDLLAVEGTFEGKKVRARLRRADLSEYPLLNGRPGRAYDPVYALCGLTLAGVGAAFWTIGGKRSNNAKLQEWLTVFLRFTLATALFAYGAAKVFPTQFPTPRLYDLLQTFGEISRMELLWTFMGASTAYMLCTGLVEILAAVLLIPRRTRLLGALVSIGIFSNVVMLSFSYEAPGKLLSVALLAASVLLAAPDLRRLVNFFVLNREVEPAAHRPLFAKASANRWAAVAWTVFLVGYGAFWLSKTYMDRRTPPRSPFYGIWNVEEMVVDGKIQPPLLTDRERWRRVVFDHPEDFAVQLMEGGKSHLLTLDAGKKTLVLTNRQDPKLKSLLSYRQPSLEVLELQGVYEGRRLQVRLRKRDMKELLLVSRGFHWVNERPYNR